MPISLAIKGAELELKVMCQQQQQQQTVTIAAPAAPTAQYRHIASAKLHQLLNSDISIMCTRNRWLFAVRYLYPKVILYRTNNVISVGVGTLRIGPCVVSQSSMETVEIM